MNQLTSHCPLNLENRVFLTSEASLCLITVSCENKRTNMEVSKIKRKGGEGSTNGQEIECARIILLLTEDWMEGSPGINQMIISNKKVFIRFSFYSFFETEVSGDLLSFRVIGSKIEKHNFSKIWRKTSFHCNFFVQK